MALNRMHASVAFVLSAAAAISTGCAAREYRVAKVNGMHYIFPPGRKIDRKQPLRNKRVPLAGLAAAGGPQCRMEGAAFAFDGRANPAVTMRLGRVFVSAFNQERMREAVEEFRLALDKLEAPAASSPAAARAPWQWWPSASRCSRSKPLTCATASTAGATISICGPA